VNILSDDVWKQIEPGLRTACPRLTPDDLQEAQQRIDLLIAKIQNRHWISKEEARRIVLGLLQGAGVLAPAQTR
jgi:hypothetical protein